MLCSFIQIHVIHSSFRAELATPRGVFLEGSAELGTPRGVFPEGSAELGTPGGVFLEGSAELGTPRGVLSVIIHQKSIKNPSKKIRKFRTKKNEKIEFFWTDLGWFGGDFGLVWEYFRTGFGPVSKSRKFEGPELKN